MAESRQLPLVYKTNTLVCEGSTPEAKITLEVECDVLWTWDKTFDDVIKVNGSIAVRRAVNVGRCASLCTSASWCSSFFFLPNTEECRLNELVFAKREDSQPAPGARYFKAESADCPRDVYVWLRGTRTCIKVYYLIPANFITAYSTCDNAGLRLAILDNIDKLRGVAGYIGDFVNPIARAFIGGMRNGAANGTQTYWNSALDPLYWLNGVMIPSNGSDSYWYLRNSNPSNSDGMEGCMEIISGLWNDIDCNNYQAYICEKI